MRRPGKAYHATLLPLPASYSRCRSASSCNCDVRCVQPRRKRRARNRSQRTGRLIDTKPRNGAGISVAYIQKPAALIYGHPKG